MTDSPIVEMDIPYGTGGGPLLLDILRPDDDDGVVRPLAIWVHGGGWEAGSRDDPPAQELVDRGFATASISYRFSDEAPFPAQIHDVKAAIRFLRANAERFGIDPLRIGIWGHSAGGHLASLAGMTGDLAELEGEGGSPGVSSAVQAVGPLAGPADFVVRGPMTRRSLATTLPSIGCSLSRCTSRRPPMMRSCGERRSRARQGTPMRVLRRISSFMETRTMWSHWESHDG